jgi:hypothetical protein
MGLSGAHRTGKSTIAARFAEKNECPFIASSAQAVAKDMGLTVDLNMAPADRRRFQDEVLRRFTAIYETEAGNGLFVTDRTPLDFAAYSLADWRPGDEEHDAWLLDYVQRCYAVTSRYFYIVGVVQPGIPYVTGEGKPSPNTVYQELLNVIIMGLARDPDVDAGLVVIPRDCTDNDTRVSVLESCYAKQISKVMTDIRENMTEQ